MLPGPKEHASQPQSNRAGYGDTGKTGDTGWILIFQKVSTVVKIVFHPFPCCGFNNLAFDALVICKKYSELRSQPVYKVLI